MKLVKSKQSQADIIFKTKVMALGDAVKNILMTNDVKSLKGIQALSGFMGMNTTLNNGSGILSYIVKETMKTYDQKKPYMGVKIRKILDAFIGFSEHKTIQVLDGFEKYGFIEYLFDAGLNPQYQQSKHPDFTRVRLTSIWTRYLKQYNAKSKETDLFIESIGRLVWASILANNNDPSGVRSFKVLVIIMENVSATGEISKKDIETFCYQIGDGRFAQLLAGDSARAEEIRFFVQVAGDKVKINDNTLECYHRYIIPISEEILERLGLDI